MFVFDKSRTIEEAFQEACRTYSSNPFLASPARADGQGGRVISYGAAAEEVDRLCRLYRAAGYGHGHRVALLLENRLEHILHKLALNSLGACCVPVNQDYRANELAYLIDHASPTLVLSVEARVQQVRDALRLARHAPNIAALESSTQQLPTCRTPVADGEPTSASAASILYTSGTTGRPKGCVLSHAYELEAGAWYANLGGAACVREGCERLYNPLPLFHVNASVLSLFCMMLTGGCQIQSDRFRPSTWWQEVRSTEATIVHYLGVIVALLLKAPASLDDRRHQVRFGLGAGVEPQLHAAFEERFGTPLVEIWGMTEMVRVLAANHEPRQVGTRAFGRPVAGLEARVVNEQGDEVPEGQAGEMVIRHSEQTPRAGFFSGYLDDEPATQSAWAGGWFHTGDFVSRDETGMLHFVERRKNIIRRAGENVAAAEVEAALMEHPAVLQAAALAVPDEIREEEVFACVVLDPQASSPTASELFDYVAARLAYFKCPGWMCFMETLPLTGSQKIQKHAIFDKGIDPTLLPQTIDLRARKRR